MPDTVFVTGGTGFLGRHLIPTLCRAGHHVRVLTRHASQHQWLSRYPNLHIIDGDITDTDAVYRGAHGSRYAVHAAGYFRFWGDDADFERTNVGGTATMIEAARAANIERLIHVSTIAVIGNPDPTRIIDETHPPRPADPYQASKLRAEQLVSASCQRDSLPAVILRPGAFYGAFGDYAFNRLFFKDPMRGLIMQVNGGSYATFQVYVPDVAAAVLAAFTRGQVGDLYHICDDPLTHKQVFDIVIEEAKLWYPRIPLPQALGVTSARVLTALARVTGREPFYPINLRSYVYNDWRVSNQKARRELGFVPTPFVDGARKTIAWYRAGQPVWTPDVEC
jgi:nucleoside-diphosphate-sugar epimerase